MTKIRRRERPVWHETEMQDDQRRRHYVVAETPAGLLIRLKGKRQALMLPWGVAYLTAARLQADANRANKKRRTVRRGGLRCV